MADRGGSIDEGPRPHYRDLPFEDVHEFIFERVPVALAGQAPGGRCRRFAPN
jgi:hypothetical protein